MKTRILLIVVITLITSYGLKAQEVENHQSFESIKTEIVDLLKQKKYSEAIALGKSTLETSKNKGDLSAFAEAYYLVSRSYALSGDFRSAIEYGENGSRLAKRLDDYELEYKVNNTLSWAYYEEGVDFSKSLEHQKRQLYVVEQLDDPKAKAQVYNNYGYDTTISGSIPLKEAIEYSKYANDYYAKEEGSQGRWYTLMNLTWQHRLLGDLKTSEHYGKLSSKQAKKDEDRHAILEAYTNLGETLMAQGKLEAAKPYYEEALEWSEKENDRDKYVFDVYYSRYLWNMGQKEKAVAILEKAVEFLETSEVFYEMLGRAYLADFYAQTKQPSKALEQIEIIENPRSNYISFEARFMAAQTRYQIEKDKKGSGALENFKPFLGRAKAVGARYLL